MKCVPSHQFVLFAFASLLPSIVESDSSDLAHCDSVRIMAAACCTEKLRGTHSDWCAYNIQWIHCFGETICFQCSPEEASAEEVGLRGLAKEILQKKCAHYKPQFDLGKPFCTGGSTNETGTTSDTLKSSHTRFSQYLVKPFILGPAGFLMVHFGWRFLGPKHSVSLSVTPSALPSYACATMAISASSTPISASVALLWILLGILLVMIIAGGTCYWRRIHPRRTLAATN